MKSIIGKVFLMVVLLIASVSVSAQQCQEVVYLKNGSIIRGMIVEEVPNKTLKIQTADGSVFICKITDVAKIARELPFQTNSARQMEADFHKPEHRGYQMDGSEIPHGYRGFLDVGYTVGVGDFGLGRVGFTTSHGYQVNQYFFIGVGSGVSFYHEPSLVNVPVFGHVRSVFLKNFIAPFVDIKAGYSFVDIQGFYFNPAVGCRFRLNDVMGMNVSVGYELQRAGFFITDGYDTETFRDNCGGVSLRCGIEF